MKSGASYHNLGCMVHAQICADVTRTDAESHRTTYRSLFPIWSKTQAPAADDPSGRDTLLT